MLRHCACKGSTLNALVFIITLLCTNGDAYGRLSASGNAMHDVRVGEKCLALLPSLVLQATTVHKERKHVGVTCEWGGMSAVTHASYWCSFAHAKRSAEAVRCGQHHWCQQRFAHHWMTPTFVEHSIIASWGATCVALCNL